MISQPFNRFNGHKTKTSSYADLQMVNQQSKNNVKTSSFPKLNCAKKQELMSRIAL